MSASAWLLVIATVCLGATAGFVAWLPWIIQPLFRILLALCYRIRIEGREHLPASGPVLLAANHVSWLDGFLLAAACPRRGRILVNAAYVDLPIVRPLAQRAGLIPVSFSGAPAFLRAIRAARAALDRGEVVGLFPEAQLTRNGLLGPFYRGLEVIVKGRDQVPVIPVALDNLWGSAFSFAGGRSFRIRPHLGRRPLNIVFGAPVHPPTTRFAVRQALLVAGVHAMALREGPRSPLETIDWTLPHLDHPELGPLTGSAPDVHQGAIHQVGHRPGSVGLPLPGVALRIVDPRGGELPPETEGELEALVVGHDWLDTHLRGRLDRDGFLYLAPFGRTTPGPA